MKSPIVSILLPILLLCLGVSAQPSANLNAKVWAAVAYINHGEKTPTFGGLDNILTPTGARQMWRQGSAFRHRYLGSRNATTFPNLTTGNTKIQGIATDAINNDQLTVLSTTDEWVSGGAMAFLQGLYPPSPNTFNTLAGGRQVAQDLFVSPDLIDYPSGGYQYPNIETLSLTDPSSVVIQGNAQCWAWDSNVHAIKMDDPMGRFRSTQSFYKSLFATPPLKGTIPNASVNYWNAYDIYEYVNYMNTHNATVTAGLGFANETIDILRANAFELERTKNGDVLKDAPTFNYNNVSTIAGQTLAMVIASSLSATSIGVGTPLTLMFGSHEPMLAFFSLIGLYTEDNLLSGPFSTLPNPGSAMIFELVGSNPGDVDAMPSPQDFMLRFSYRANADLGEPFSAYPLTSMGFESQMIPYASFLAQLQNFTQDSVQWCATCRAVFAPWCNTGADESPSDPPSTSKGCPLSPALGGLIGAMVTLAVALLAIGVLNWFGFVTFSRRSKPGVRSGSPGGFRGSDKRAGDADVTVTDRGVQHERVGSWELRDGPGESPIEPAEIGTTNLSRLDDDEISLTGVQPVKIHETV